MGASQAESSAAWEMTSRSIPSWSGMVIFLFFFVLIGASLCLMGGLIR
jgi:hypothetical protein